MTFSAVLGVNCLVGVVLMDCWVGEALIGCFPILGGGCLRVIDIG